MSEISNVAKMKIYRRLMLIGDGGIGGRLVVQAEHALRAALCGPGGTALADGSFARAMAPYELPRCIQSVYFDFDEADAENVRRSTADLPANVVASTRQIVELAPPADSFADAAEMLRINHRESVSAWLPDADGEPQKAPLSSGAGQLPTIGRAALFEAFRSQGGVHVVTQALGKAFARLAAAGGDLAALSGSSAHSGIDVFLAFSAAGGTGAGTFLDLLRLIAHVHEDQNGPESDLAIYPLVVMPSALPTDGKPKERRFHELNAGLVLRDLFEVVDLTHTCPTSIPKIVYPGDIEPVITAAVPAKTVVLFSRPQTLEMDDLLRSIVSFVLSIVGTTVSTDRGGEFIPLSSQLINAALQGQPAPDGIGNRPASTALAAELRIPVEEIAETLSQHLLAAATRQLGEPGPGEERENLRLFDRFGAASKLDELVNPVAPIELPAIDGRGAAEITSQLQKRAKRAVEARAALRSRLEINLSRLAREADYGAGIEALAADYDLFRVARVLLGHSKYTEEIMRSGFRGAVARIGQEPPPNARQFTDAPPALPALQDRYKGLQRIAVNDPAVREAIKLQDEWLRWAADQTCHEVWKRYQDAWEPRLRAMEERIREVLQGFEAHAAAEAEDFRHRCGRLYRKRTGVVDLVPDGGVSNDLEPWYRGTVLPRLCEALGLPEGSGEDRIAREIMHGRWREAYEATTVEADATAARNLTLDAVRKLLKTKVLAATGAENPLLPSLEALLREAAYASPDKRSKVSENLITALQRALQQLLPTDFRPGGAEDGVSGELRVNVFYPAGQPDVAIERYLENTALTSIQQQHHEFHPLAGVDFISVVLRREALPATAIEEYRRLMRVRAQALEHAAPGDLLPWRQRLGHDPTWLMLRRDERVGVLTSFLAALWDGSVKVSAGTDADPKQILVYQVDPTAGAPMILDLRGTSGGVSRWVDLVCAYERYVLAADQQGLARCKALIARKEPHSDTRPASLYVKLLAIAQAEAAKARQMHEHIRRERIESGYMGMLPTPREVQFWELLTEANEINQRRSYRWRVDPSIDPTHNGAVPAAAPVE
jgi:hypothetical protein